MVCEAEPTVIEGSRLVNERSCNLGLARVLKRFQMVVMVLALVLAAGVTGYVVATLLDDDPEVPQSPRGGISGGDPAVTIPPGVGPNVDPREECRKQTELARDELREICATLGFDLRGGRGSR